MGCDEAVHCMRVNNCLLSVTVKMLQPMVLNKGKRTQMEVCLQLQYNKHPFSNEEPAKKQTFSQTIYFPMQMVVLVRNTEFTLSKEWNGYSK